VHAANISSGIENKWNKINRITQDNIRGHCKEARNLPLHNHERGNGRTQEIVSSLSSQDRMNVKETIKNHRMS